MLTVGTNPLPVWMALRHLKDKLPPIHVRFVHTKETEPEADRLLCGASQKAQQLIQAELKEETGHSSLSLEIWGKDTWYRLQQTFHQYLCTTFGWT